MSADPRARAHGPVRGRDHADVTFEPDVRRSIGPPSTLRTASGGPAWLSFIGLPAIDSGALKVAGRDGVLFGRKGPPSAAKGRRG